MKIHQKIMYHVQKHKDNIAEHIKKHKHKYLVGTWIAWWIATYKIIWMIAIFLGTTYMGGWSIWADYYDDEYYAQEAAKKININSAIDTTCSTTGTSNSWIVGTCPLNTK